MLQNCPTVLDIILETDSSISYRANWVALKNELIQKPGVFSLQFDIQSIADSSLVTQRLKSAGFKEILYNSPFFLYDRLCSLLSLFLNPRWHIMTYYYSHRCTSAKTISELLFHDKGDNVRITELPKITEEKFS